MKKVFNKQINEHLTSNDLRWLVDDSILIDMHKTKMGADKDYIVLSIAVNDRTPAHDLARFIENSVYKFSDIEVSPATDNKGRYLVYIEIERNDQAFEAIKGILEDSTKLSGIKSWKFKTIGFNDYMIFDEQAFKSNIILDPTLYEQRYPSTEKPDLDITPDIEDTEKKNVRESIKSRLKFLLTY